ncbi:AarF/ABC1/UbiB kinase family protein [Paraconexibacter antarcticus]|uniref:AarF/ABC1/UbiB kinase family protein n=1 Tax=Paraconexibacter antarcticus TaxID=2949664 RepID=A0ABY5DUW0_9ACTN|nr:AarF/ABC1/UbiB kinase family protein [Paraconexibacter antarcticus]UTI64482.1 AarF/ABC1/UbiB kinase family protein [Paraconexibacter antarcticus]
MSPKIPTSRLGRTAKFGGLVAGQGARWVGTNTANRFRSDEKADEKLGERAMDTANEIVAQLGQMKGAAMKIGQVLSTIDFELVPEGERENFKAKLAQLRDDAPRVPFAKMRKVLEQDLDGRMSDVFAAFDEEPIAAASIGQVYRATTHDGREVAVKVQYPGVAEAVETDLRNANLLFPLVKRLAPGLDVKAIAGELKDRIGEELDYEIEAQHQRAVARAFRGHPFVTIPAVDTALSTRRVLVTEFIEGVGFAAVADRPEAERDRYGEILYRFYFGLLNREHLACGDPHPGNVIFTPDGKVCFLDFGLMRKVPDEYLEGERQIGRALLAEDAVGVHRQLGVLGYLPDPGSFPVDDVHAQLKAAGAWYLEPGFRRITPDLVREIMEVAGSPRSPYFEAMRRQTVPAEALLIRRMEGLLFAVLGELRAGADWNALMRESLEPGTRPTTELGEAEAAWAGRARPPAGAVA